jgi:hypothetical protein
MAETSQRGHMESHPFFTYVKHLEREREIDVFLKTASLMFLNELFFFFNKLFFHLSSIFQNRCLYA